MSKAYITTTGELMKALQLYPVGTPVKIMTLDYHNVPTYTPVQSPRKQVVTPMMHSNEMGACCDCDPCPLDCSNRHYTVVVLEAR